MPNVSKTAGKPRAHTRGVAGTGMSHGQLIESGQMMDSQYPREPSHYLGQPPPMTQQQDDDSQ